MTEEEAFIEAIRADPDEDTHRLVYADWLAENGQEDRGNLIRCQIELAEHDAWAAKQFMVLPESRRGGRIGQLRAYSRDAIIAHPEWSKVQCVACGDGANLTVKQWLNSPSNPCPTCHGTGDLLETQHIDPTGTEVTGGRRHEWGRATRPLTWSRGFIGSIEARSGELWAVDVDASQSEGEREYVPTAWALAVVKALPLLREIRVTDKESISRVRGGDSTYSEFGWARSVGMDSLACIPGVIWDMLEGGYVWAEGWKVYPALKLANRALARAVCAWVRSFIPQATAP